jgi:rsbT antagonist protein RsbS
MPTVRARQLTKPEPVASPILKHGEVLIASLQPDLTDSDLAQLSDELALKVGSARARGVILDVSALDVVDSFAARTLRAISHTARLRGADTVIVGIQPDVAFSMVQLGITLEDVTTALDLEEGLARLHARRQA